MYTQTPPEDCEHFWFHLDKIVVANGFRLIGMNEHIHCRFLVANVESEQVQKALATEASQPYW